MYSCDFSLKNGQSRNNVDAVIELLVDKYGELICTLPLLCFTVSFFLALIRSIC